MTSPMSIQDQKLLEQAYQQFDQLNGLDPRTILVAGELRPRELVQADRLEIWVKKVAPTPSLALLLAARCQHLMRFSVPRSDYPDGRVGYLTWRKDLARIQADKVTAILQELGASDALVEEVRAINLKQNLKVNADVQAMEDALCLSFLEHDFVPFIDRYDDEMIVNLVRKTWRKMSPRGHELALTLPLGGRALALIQKALATEADAPN